MKTSQRRALSTDPVDCRECSIGKCDFFQDLQETDSYSRNPPIEAMRFTSGSTLYNTDDPGEWLFTVREGLVKLIQYLPDGTYRIVRLLRPGAVAGMEALLARPYEHTAVTLQPTLVCRIPIEIILQLDSNRPRFHRQLREHWHTSLQEADEWLIELSTGHARARVARLFLFLLDASGTECDLFSREDIGAMLGLTTETVSRVIADFKRTDLIIETGPLRCHCSVPALREISFEVSTLANGNSPQGTSDDAK